MPNNETQQKLIEELSGILDRAAEILREIKGHSSPNHKWVKRKADGFRTDGANWWHCEKCLITPTRVKPNRVNEDRPMESACPGPAIFEDNI
jgi:hypothetical protein